MKRFSSRNQIWTSIITLLLSIITVVMGVFAWSSSNRNLSSNGMGMQVDGKLAKVEYKIVRRNGIAVSPQEEYAEIDPAKLLPIGERLQKPGDSVTYSFKITNTGTDAITVQSFGLDIPLAAEERANSEGYYFGTQIKVTAYLVDEMLASYSDGKTLKPLTAVQLRYGIDLAANAYDEFETTFTFVNKNERQNEYIGFGQNDDGACARRLYLNFAD